MTLRSTVLIAENEKKQETAKILPLLARGAISAMFLETEVDAAFDCLRLAPPVQRLNVTLRRKGKLRGSMSASGKSLYDQLMLATRRAALDGRFDGPIAKNEVSELSIEIWSQYSKEPLALPERAIEGTVDLGLHGVEVRSGANEAYYKPSVALTAKISKQTQLLSQVCKKAGLSSDAWQSDETEVFITLWTCVVVEEQSAMVANVQRLRCRDDVVLSSAIVDHWAKSSALYLVSNQNAKGELTYLLNPIEGQPLRERPNPVRTSGCFLALATVADHWSDPELTGSIKRCLALMYRQIWRRSRLWKLNTCRVILDSEGQLDAAKLGTTALFACGLLQLPFLSITQEERKQMLNTLKSVQDRSGRFYSHVGSEVIDARSESYSSGQALLALTLSAEQGDTNALHACERAFQPYKELFREKPTTAFVGWHIDVWTRLAKLTRNSAYAEFSFFLADWLVELQIKESSRSEWVGGFARSSSHPTASSTVFTEALCCALDMAVTVGDEMRVARYSDAVRKGLLFCQRLRTDNIPELYRQRPERSNGGISMSLSDLNIRCDFVQHFITMCLKAHVCPSLF